MLIKIARIRYLRLNYCWIFLPVICAVSYFVFGWNLGGLSSSATTKDTVGLHPDLKITQSRILALTNGYKFSLICEASVHVNTTAQYIDMRWSGVGLQQSLWVKQSNISRQEDYIKRTLYFEPWLDLHAGEYTCSLVIRNVDNCYFMMNKTIEIKGKYRGLINSRNTTQKFSTSLGKPSKWFPNVDFCGPSDVWENFADYHASVLSGKQKGKYLIYDCSSGYDCGGYGNRIHGITALLILAMLTKRVFLIQMTNPTDINTFLQPNAIQWNYTLPEELKSYNINLYRKKNFYSNFRTLENALLGNDEYDVLRVRINSGLFFILVAMSDHMTDNMISTFILKTQYDLVLLYGCAYNYLFKYQPTVIQSINSLKTELGLETGKYVALHVRSFIDEGWILNPFNLKFPFKPMFECALMAANSLSRKMNASKVPIFFTTDHPSIIEFAKDNYNDVLVFSRAPMFHIDHTKFNGAKANSQYNSGTIGVLSDVEICSRATVLIRSAASTLSEVMGAIHFFSPQNNLHPYYFYENISLCHDHPL